MQNRIICRNRQLTCERRSRYLVAYDEIGLYPHLAEPQEWLWLCSESKKVSFEPQKYLIRQRPYLQADDDTFIFTSNLYEYLKAFDPNSFAYVGYRMDVGGHHYMSGGAGYVLTRATVRALVVFMTSSSWSFPREMKYEDQGKSGNWTSITPQVILTSSLFSGMGYTMLILKVPFIDAVDEVGRARFIPNKLTTHILGHKRDKYRPHCCSPSLISLHYLRADELYRIENRITNQSL